MNHHPSMKSVNRGLCIECGRPLVAIGLLRKNGKNHPDWVTRRLHKKCYRTHELKKYCSMLDEQREAMSLLVNNKYPSQN